MKLKRSWVYRRSVHAGRTTSIDAEWVMPPTGALHHGVEFAFDLGTDEKSEKITLFLHNADFENIARLMAEADREKAIQAFAKALIWKKG
ncbi:hypothetical protein [Gellertiella hungarica]|uniref:Uncharacterized protein n=1 Tax=Gellertiella hungarica TaxID=1572859 RepID=A0A7W6J8Z9_9HYPH|nr:hypothetical protein [Gellertiella hungarica]MBB4067005.1 hypothetical protein [Gellertiella hungarica]